MPGHPLQLRHVSCRLGGSEVLADINLTLPPSARCVIAGPSGAGKTSLLRTLAGLLPPSTGTVHLAGIDITSLPPEHRGFGWVGADPGLLPGLAVMAQVEVALRLAKFPAGQRHAAARSALESVGLGNRLGHLPHELSSGEALRVALARAFVTTPRCLLLDEPLARIDPAQRSVLRQRLSRWQDETGGTVIESSHCLQESLPGASHVLLLRSGRVVQFAEAEAVWRKPASPWVADFLATLPVWWSAPEEARHRGWQGPVPEPTSPCTVIGVRLDLATWQDSRPSTSCLGPLRASRFHMTGPLASVEATFPDGARLWVPTKRSGSPPCPGIEGWAAFGPDAVVWGSKDDRA